MRKPIFMRISAKNYLERIKPSLIVPLIFAGFVIAIGYLGTNSAWTILAGIALFAFYLNERMKWGRIYITEICELAGDRLQITYMDRNEIKQYTGDKKSLSIERTFVKYKLRADKEQYLIFKDIARGFTLKQYALGDWVDEKIDELISNWQPQADTNPVTA